MKKNQKSNNNDNNKSNLSSVRSESSVYSTRSSARSESSKKTLISDHELEKSVYFTDVANIIDIDTLESKNETETSFYYLKDKINKLFKDYSKIFDSDLKNFFKDIASEGEKNINHNLLSKEIYSSSGDVFSFFSRYGDLHEFCFALFEEKNIYAGDIKFEQIKFLKDLMNGYKVHKRFERFKSVNDFYLKLHANVSRTVHDIFLKNPTDKYNKKIYLQVKILFDLRDKIFKKLLYKGTIKNNPSQSDIKYEETVAERTKLRRQAEEEKNVRNEDGLIDYDKLMRLISLEKRDINMELFKKYFNFKMPSETLETIYNLNDKNKNNMLVSIIKSGLSDLKNEIKNMSEDEIIMEKPNEIVDIVEKILEFNQQNQHGKGLKILTPNQMLSRLPIGLAQLNAGNNSEKLKNVIRQLLYSLCR